jgi:phenylacetate-CoA ligase
MARIIVACEGAGPGLADALSVELGVSCDVRVLPAGSIPRVEAGKAVRVVTWESGEAPLSGLD